jgi:hypothetical protein
MGVREPASQLGGDDAFVARVPVRVKQADGNGLRIDIGQRGEVEWLELTIHTHAPTHAVRALERHERLRPRRARPVQVRARLAPQVEQVLEARVGDECRPCALPLEQRVRRDCRPVRKALDPTGARSSCRRHDGFLLPR